MKIIRGGAFLKKNIKQIMCVNICIGALKVNSNPISKIEIAD